MAFKRGDAEPPAGYEAAAAWEQEWLREAIRKADDAPARPVARPPSRAAAAPPDPVFVKLEREEFPVKHAMLAQDVGAEALL
eukprot:15216258-Alexandrium_andersonii.AAC.1